MQIMKDEIFGPLLPVKTYGGVDEAIAYVNEHARPLGLYYFGSDSAEQSQVLTRTMSGGVSVNDVIMHVQHGGPAFRRHRALGHGRLSRHRRLPDLQPPKAVFQQTKMDVTAMMRPPFGDKIQKMMDGQIKR